VTELADVVGERLMIGADMFDRHQRHIDDVN